MARGLKGKTALVTGGASGLGRATALRFAQEGAAVAVADLGVEAGEALVREINDAGGKAIFIRTDVSKASEVEAMVNEVVETFGSLDFAVNNAGIEGISAPTAECTEENFDKVISINLKGVFLGMKYEIPHMLKQGKGAIVNMSSVAGLVGFLNMPAYCASKGGVIQLTKTAALEYSSKGIRVNAVCPGAIRTAMVDRIEETDANMKAALEAMHPIGRIGKAEEIADAVVWLCSDESSFVTGHAMAVDGGFVAG